MAFLPPLNSLWGPLLHCSEQVTKLGVPKIVSSFLTSWEAISFSRSFLKLATDLFENLLGAPILELTLMYSTLE
jgi:hypothetical protein